MDKMDGAWKQFFTTGKVEDYLQVVKEREGKKPCEENAKETKRDAGFCGSNGNGII